MHDLLRSSGLERFYELRAGPGQAVGAVPIPSSREWLPELEAQGRLAGKQVRLTLDVQGIHCAACVWVLEELWRRQPGALRFELNPSLGQAVLVYDRSRLDLGRWLDRVERLGYRMAPASKRADDVERGLLMRLGVCAALAMNAMMFALARYLGMSPADGAAHELFGSLSLGLSTLAVLVGGPVFFRAALAGLRQRVLHLDLPISLGILLAWGGSLSVVLSGRGEGYFDTVTVFVTLMLAGRWLQRRAVRRNRDYLLQNDGAEHLRARRLREGSLESVPLDRLAVGDHLLLASGDLVPARCRLLQRAQAFSLDWILGESEPRTFEPGAEVPAGAFHGGRRPARLEVVADPRASGLLALLATPPPGADDLAAAGSFWSLLNRIYVAAVLVLAAAGGLIWLALAPERALAVTTSILVVTCPCALGLAIPLAFQLGLADLRRHGVFVRTTALLDKARAVRKVVFDKTGTVTWGGLRATVLRPPAAEHRAVLSTMAGSSSHPVSRAVAGALAPARLPFLDDLAVEEHVGRGLEANRGGHRYRLGSAAFCFDEPPRRDDDDLCLFTRDGHVEACFQLEEDVRTGFREEIEALRAAGRSVFLLTGDRRCRALAVAERLGLPVGAVYADALPDAKAAFVAALDRHDTLMVGDGLNDSGAFEAAYCAGTPAVDRPVMPARADFFFNGAVTGAVSRILEAAGRFHGVVTANLWLAGVYNATALALCFAGLMSPLVCAVLMPLSSLVLLAHTASRMRAKEP